MNPSPERIWTSACIAIFAVLLACAWALGRGSSAEDASLGGLADTTAVLTGLPESPGMEVWGGDQHPVTVEDGRNAGQPVDRKTPSTDPILPPVTWEDLMPPVEPRYPALVVNPEAVTVIGWYFLLPDQPRAGAIRWCESRGVPDVRNPGSTATGWFQEIADSYETARHHLAAMGVDVPPFSAGAVDAETNTAVASWLRYYGGGWGHWNASAECWGRP